MTIAYRKKWNGDKPWTASDVELLARLLEDHRINFTDIADRMGRTKSSVVAYVHRSDRMMALRRQRPLYVKSRQT